jgi:DNA-binding CsgD family transcriptional regulator
MERSGFRDGYRRRWGGEEDCSLTPREREILWLVAQRKQNRDIGELLGISICTVKIHLANIFFKLGVHRRGEAVRVATQQGSGLPA